MNWIKENQFLSGFLGAMLLGFLVFGYLFWSAKSRYEEVSAQYQEQADLYGRLNSAPIYPSPKNLTLIEAQRKEHQEAVATLQKNLGTNEIAAEPITEVQFQDRLRESVNRLTAAMTAKEMKFDEKFYMGFGQYQAQPPRPEAAPALGRQLKAIEQVMDVLVNNNARVLTKLERTPLPEESDDHKPPARGEKGSKDLIARHPIEIGFTTDHSSFQNILNSIASSKTQFYIPRLIEVKNEKEKGPPRGETAFGAATPPAPDAAAAAPPTAAGARPGAAGAPGAPAAPATPALPQITFIVGDEKIDVGMRIDIVDFADIAVAE